MITDINSDMWIADLLIRNKCSDVNDLPYGVIIEEIKDVKSSISNERIWSFGAGTMTATEMHLHNIEALTDYLAVLNEIREEKEVEQPDLPVNKNNPEGKDIRFINSKYEELFRIPDGDYITITRNNGEQLIRKCVFMDECHTSFNGYTYHICQFAEMMERSGNKYAPCPTPEKVAGYMITDRIPINNKEFVMAHNPKAVSPYVTWVRHKDYPGYEIGHYWSERRIAKTDLFRRADAEQTGKSYDHTKLYKENREVNAR